MGNNVLKNLLSYGTEYMKKISRQEQVERNYLSVVDASINENIILRQDFDLSENNKRLNSLKISRKNYCTLIINATGWTNDRKVEIDKLSRKRDIFSNDANRIRKHKNNLKSI